MYHRALFNLLLILSSIYYMITSCQPYQNKESNRGKGIKVFVILIHNSTTQNQLNVVEINTIQNAIYMHFSSYIFLGIFKYKTADDYLQFLKNIIRYIYTGLIFL